MRSKSTLRWVEFWQRVGKETPGREITAEEMAEMLWLSAKLDAPPPRAPEADAQHPLSRAADAPPPLPPAAPRALPPAPQSGRSSGVSMAETLPGEAAADLYPQHAAAGGAGVGAVPVRAPGGRALPGALAMARALRPLKRRIPSARDLVLDETATAERIAHTQEWVPVLRPAPERWLTLTLVVDESETMVVWEHFAAALQTLLARLGAFRDIEVWSVASSADGSTADVRRGLGSALDPAAPPPARSPAEIGDQQGRNLILVVSDCRSPAWYAGTMSRMLAAWGARQPVAILQVLPRRLWAQTALQQHVGIFVRSPLPGGVNRNLEVRWGSPDDATDYGHGIPVPVLLPDPAWLNLWARALAGNSRLWVPGVMLIDYDWRAESRALHEAGQEAGPAQALALLRRFQGSASLTARRLAAYYTAVPLTLPVMRLVQSALAPDSTPMHLAEIFLSGLLRPLPPQPGGGQSEPEFAFIAPEVPQLLANSLAVDELRRVLEAVSRYAGARFGQPLDFAALLADPSAAGPLALDDQNKPFARVAAPVLERFGGPYAQLAQRLQRALGERVIERPLPVAEPGTRPAEEGQRATRTGTLRALVVGIDRYADATLSGGLGGARDAGNVARALRFVGLDAAHLTLLLDEAATGAAIRAALDGLTEGAQEGDTVLLYFAGLSSRLPTQGQAADGFDEALAPYDQPAAGGDRAISHADLVRFAAALGELKVRVALVLDTSYAGGGAFTQAALDNLVVLAACREDEAGSTLPGPEPEGAFTHYFCAALEGFHPAMTWGDVHEAVLASLYSVRARQSPQLIGDANLTLTGAAAPALAAPYLLVVDAARDNSTVTVAAPAPLGLEPGAILSIFPPGSRFDASPLAAASVNRVDALTATARLEQPLAIPPGSRAQVAAASEASRLSVVPDTTYEILPPLSGFVHYGTSLEGNPVYARLRDGAWWVETADGQPLLNGAKDADPHSAAMAVEAALEHLARFRLAWRAQNGAGAGKGAPVEVALLARNAAESGLAAGSAVTAGQPMSLRLTNRSQEPLHLSLWRFSETLRVERIFPRTSDWLLFAPGATITQPVRLYVDKPDGEQEAIALRAFAVSQPVALDLLRLPALDPTVRVHWENVRAWLDEQRAAPAVPERPARKGRAQAAAKERTAGPVELKGGGVEFKKCWKPGATVRIRFLDGEAAVQRRVARVAREWTKYANIRFEFGDDPNAEVRVSFKPGAGSWSYVGTDALAVAKDQPTMNLGWITAKTQQSEVQRVVLHEFGHVLGLVCEATYNTTIPWDRNKVMASFSGPPNNWSREQIEAQFFRTPPEEYPPEGLWMKEFDPYSVMLWPISKDLTIGGFETHLNTELSNVDKRFIAEVYPHDANAA